MSRHIGKKRPRRVATTPEPRPAPTGNDLLDVAAYVEWSKSSPMVTMAVSGYLMVVDHCARMGVDPASLTPPQLAESLAQELAGRQAA